MPIKKDRLRITGLLTYTNCEKYKMAPTS